MSISDSIENVFVKIYRKDILKAVLQPISVTWTKIINGDPSSWEAEFKRYHDMINYNNILWSSSANFSAGTHTNTTGSLVSGEITLSIQGT